MLPVHITQLLSSNKTIEDKPDYEPCRPQRWNTATTRRQIDIRATRSDNSAPNSIIINNEAFVLRVSDIRNLTCFIIGWSIVQHLEEDKDNHDLLSDYDELSPTKSSPIFCENHHRLLTSQ
jgi:hypothetical protein